MLCDTNAAPAGITDPYGRCRRISTPFVAGFAAAKSATVTIKPKRVAVRCIISFPGNYLSDYFPLGHACLCVLQAPFHVVSGFGSNETRDKPRAGSVARLLAFTRSGAVGFIDWLDGFIDMQAHVLNAFATAVSNDNIR